MKLDKQNRLFIPKEVLELSTIDLTQEVRIYLQGNEFFLDNPHNKHINKDCLGKIKIHPKHHFFVPTQIRDAFRLVTGDIILCFIREGTITFRKV